MFPTSDSSRAINLSCDIRPGVREEQYAVEWQQNSFTSLPYDTFDISVSLQPSSSTQQYQCRVTIEHRNDTGASKKVYNGPIITLEQKGIYI